MKTADNITAAQKMRKRHMAIPILAILVFMGIVLIYYRMLYTEKRTNIIKDGEMTAEKTADLIDKYISSNMDSVSLAAYALDEMITTKRSDDEIQDFMVRQSDAIIASVDEDSTGFYGYINGKFHSGTNWVAPKGYDATQRPWYINAMASPGEITLLDTYHDIQSGHHMIAIGKVLCDGTSVISMDIPFTEIQKIVDGAVDSGDADIGMVISDNNLVIAHSDRSEVGRDYDVQSGSLGEMIVKNLKDKENYYFLLKYEGSDYLIYVSSLKCGLHCISVKNASGAFSSMKWILFGTMAVVIASIIGISSIINYFRNHQIDSYNFQPPEREHVPQEKSSPAGFVPLSDTYPQKSLYSKRDISHTYDYSTDKKITSLSSRILRLVFTILLVSEALICAASIIQSRAAIRSSVCQRMIDIANCAAGSVDGDIHKRLTPEDVGSDEYMKIYNSLAVYRDNVELEYVYALRVEDDGRFTYTVDPSVDEPEEFGDELEYTEGLYRASLGEPSVDDWQATDEWGTFYSSYSPIFDSAGEVAGIVGVDFSVEWFKGQMNRHTMNMVLISLIILFVTAAFTWIMCFVWIRSVTGPLEYMTDVAKHYAVGDFSEAIETNTNDEIGILSHTLQSMAGSLQEQVVKAEAANKAKSSFLANMSHEIRTPLNTVLGMNEMILKESDDNVILGYAQNIKAAGRSLLNLINDILDFSKIEAGKTEITLVDYDLSDLLDDLLMMMQSRAFDKGLEFEIDFDPKTPKGLHGDEYRIRQIITNLLTNAIKYTREGSITFHVGYEDSENPDEIYLNVAVEDTGIGIRKEDMDRLFSKFERLDQNKNRSIEGTGLGLSITSSLLENMDSSLEVESEYGKGSVFSFKLRQPVVNRSPIGDYKNFSQTHQKSMERSAVNFTAPSANILAVDDNPINLLVLSNLLKHTRANVDTADCGDNAVKLSEKRMYDLIFLDHMMPEKDGIETLKDIRTNPDNPNQQTPAVCLTANAIVGAREQYLSHGFDSYLSKPIDTQLLEECLLEYLPDEKIVITEAVENTFESASPVVSNVLNDIRKQNILSTEEGLKNNSTADAYLSILHMYLSAVDDKAAELDRMFNENNLSDYAIQIHALKSSSRIIGAMDLGDAAQKLENASKAGDTEYLRLHHGLFLTEYRLLKDKLSEILDKDLKSDIPDNEKEPADDDMLKKVYNDIMDSARQKDIDRLEDILADIGRYSIPDEEKPILDSIKEATDNFDYKSVLEIVGSKIAG